MFQADTDEENLAAPNTVGDLNPEKLHEGLCTLRSGDELFGSMTIPVGSMPGIFVWDARVRQNGGGGWKVLKDGGKVFIPMHQIQFVQYGRKGYLVGPDQPDPSKAQQNFR